MKILNTPSGSLIKLVQHKRLMFTRNTLVQEFLLDEPVEESKSIAFLLPPSQGDMTSFQAEHYMVQVSLSDIVDGKANKIKLERGLAESGDMFPTVMILTYNRVKSKQIYHLVNANQMKYINSNVNYEKVIMSISSKSTGTANRYFDVPTIELDTDYSSPRLDPSYDNDMDIRVELLELY